jgi:hypothetical protein
VIIIVVSSSATTLELPNTIEELVIDRSRMSFKIRQTDQENLRSHSIASKSPSNFPEYVRKIGVFGINSVGVQGRWAAWTKKSIYVL